MGSVQSQAQRHARQEAASAIGIDRRIAQIDSAVEKATDRGRTAVAMKLVAEQRNLTPAEQAAHHAKRKELHEKLHPETKHGGDRKSAERKSKPQNADLKSYAEEAAAKTGQEPRHGRAFRQARHRYPQCRRTSRHLS
jgi:ParB family chromosome partitioning protein